MKGLTDQVAHRVLTPTFWFSQSVSILLVIGLVALFYFDSFAFQVSLEANDRPARTPSPPAGAFAKSSSATVILHEADEYDVTPIAVRGMVAPAATTVTNPSTALVLIATAVIPDVIGIMKKTAADTAIVEVDGDVAGKWPTVDKVQVKPVVMPAAVRVEEEEAEAGVRHCNGDEGGFRGSWEGCHRKVDDAFYIDDSENEEAGGDAEASNNGTARSLRNCWLATPSSETYAPLPTFSEWMQQQVGHSLHDRRNRSGAKGSKILPTRRIRQGG